MKNRYWFFAGLLLVVLAGCGNPSGGGPPKFVAAEYRFHNIGGNFQLSEDIILKIGGSGYLLTGAYTEGGGTFTNNEGSGKWAYLYDNTGKKGFVCHYTAGNPHTDLKWAYLGSVKVGEQISLPGQSFTPALSTNGVSASPVDSQNNYGLPE